MAALLHTVLVHIKTFMSMHSASIANISSKPKIMEIIRKIFDLNLIKRHMLIKTRLPDLFEFMSKPQDDPKLEEKRKCLIMT